MFMAGWVILFVSTIPIVVGIVVMQQGAYGPLVIGGMTLAAAISLIISGWMKRSVSPLTTGQVPKPETARTGPG